MTNGLLGDLLPDLDEGISQLLDILWCDVAVVDATIHDVPEVLDWIQVWEEGGEENRVNALTVQELLTHSIHMKLGTVMHQQEPRAQWSSKQSDLCLKIRVPNSFQCTSIQHRRVCIALHG